MSAIQTLLRVPKDHRDRTFLIDTIGDRTWTFGDLHEQALRVGNALRARGLAPGDRVAPLLHNSAEFAAIYFGCLYARLVVVPINPALGRAEAGEIVVASGARLVIISAETLSLVDTDQLSEGGVDSLLLLDGRGEAKDATVAVFDLAALPPSDGFVPLDGASDDDTMAIFLTSGTTGRPTGVVHRISDLVNNAGSFSERMGIGPDNRFYGLLAMAYLGGFFNLLLLPYLAGASVVLRSAFDSRAALNFWELAQVHRVNTLWFVPTIVSILLEMDRGSDGARFCRENVRLALVGTAPLAVPQRRRFEERYGVRLYDNYGLSETCFVSTQAPRFGTVKGSVGRPLPEVDVRIVDEAGAALADGDEGEIQVRSPHCLEGWYDLDTRQVRPFDRDGWFSTGDVGVRTRSGELYVTGRKKDLIIRGGVNVSPAQISNVLNAHSAVAECAVVGIPHALYGEDIAAVVAMAGGASFESVRGELVALCKAKLGAAKQPAQLLEMPEMPRGSTGKILKDRIRELLIHKLDLSALAHEQARVRPARVSASDRLPAQVVSSFPRPDRALVEAFSALSTRAVARARNGMGGMDAAIHSLVRGRPFVGAALTIEEPDGGGAMTALALDALRPGDVLVVDAKGITSRACWDAASTRAAVARGAAAVIVDGAVADLDAVQASDLPLYAKGVSPNDSVRGEAGAVGRAIACGGQAVRAGDIVLGDDGGVVVIPQDLARELLACCREER